MSAETSSRRFFTCALAPVIDRSSSARDFISCPAYMKQDFIEGVFDGPEYADCIWCCMYICDAAPFALSFLSEFHYFEEFPSETVCNFQF